MISDPPVYDANGNVTADGFHTYAWDAEGRTVTIDSGTFTYDALDRRLDFGASGSYQQYFYPPFDLNYNFGQAVGTSGQLGLRLPTPGGGQVNMAPSGVTGYRHPNWQGSQVVNSTTTRTVAADNAFTPFGERYAINGISGYFAGMLMQYPYMQDGYQADERLYHDGQGRWVSPDPAGLGAVDLTNPQSLNRYVYVMNDPLNNVDPSGLDANNGTICYTTSGVGQQGIIFQVTTTCAVYAALSPPPNTVGGQVIYAQAGYTGGAAGTAPNNGIANNARCAAANASSIASLVGISKDNWFGQALLGNDIATASNLVFGPGRLSSAGQAALSSPLKYNAINHIAAGYGAMDSGTGRWLNIGSVDEFGNPSAVFKGLSVAETAAGKAISEAAGVFTAAKLAFDTGAYAYAYAKCSGVIH